jgi:Alkylmercury lyase
MANVVILTANELIALDVEGRGRARRAARETPTATRILQNLAYPFSASPTPFLVRLPDGRERHVCCAIDALGIAPMVGQAVEIRPSHESGSLTEKLRE